MFSLLNTLKLPKKLSAISLFLDVILGLSQGVGVFMLIPLLQNFYTSKSTSESFFLDRFNMLFHDPELIDLLFYYFKLFLYLDLEVQSKIYQQVYPAASH